MMKIVMCLNPFYTLLIALMQIMLSLPSHMRCSAHTLNLVATTDADSLDNDSSYERSCTSVFAKAQELITDNERISLSVKNFSAFPLHYLFLVFEQRQCELYLPIFQLVGVMPPLFSIVLY